MATARNLWDRLAHAGIRLTFLPADEQTRLSWARLARSYADLPEVFREPLAALVGGGGGFPYTVLTPTFQGFLRRQGEKLVCILGGEIWVMEKVQDRAVSTCYPVRRINTIEAGSILLKAWLTIRGLDNTGALGASTLHFNAVGESLFTPILGAIRPAPCPSAGVGHNAEMAKFDRLAPLSFKFMNYARRTIIPGEEVVRFIFQPEVRLGAPRLLGRSWWRATHPAHLTILTSCRGDPMWSPSSSIIIIRDETAVRWNPNARHGGIWTYIPLDRITSTSLAKTDAGMLVLSIHLPAGDRVDALFSASQENDLSQLLARVDTLAR